jgi:phage-related protein
MPETRTIYYCDDDGSAPVLEWLEQLGRKDKRAAARCAARIELLEQLGHELRRPIADILRDGIYELRTRNGNIQYRILYFFSGKNVVVLSQGFVKRGSAVPDKEIERALERKLKFEKNPKKHTYQG